MYIYYITEYSSLLIMIFNNDNIIFGLLSMMNDSLLINGFNRENIKNSDIYLMLLIKNMICIDSFLNGNTSSNNKGRII